MRRIISAPFPRLGVDAGLGEVVSSVGLHREEGVDDAIGSVGRIRFDLLLAKIKVDKEPLSGAGVWNPDVHVLGLTIALEVFASAYMMSSDTPSSLSLPKLRHCQQEYLQ